MKARKQKVAKKRAPKLKPKQDSAVYDIIKLMETNHAKADLALIEIKHLCMKK